MYHAAMLCNLNAGSDSSFPLEWNGELQVQSLFFLERAMPSAVSMQAACEPQKPAVLLVARGRRTSTIGSLDAEQKETAPPWEVVTIWQNTKQHKLPGCMKGCQALLQFGADPGSLLPEKLGIALEAFMHSGRPTVVQGSPVVLKWRPG